MCTVAQCRTCNIFTVCGDLTDQFCMAEKDRVICSLLVPWFAQDTGKLEAFSSQECTGQTFNMWHSRQPWQWHTGHLSWGMSSSCALKNQNENYFLLHPKRFSQKIMHNWNKMLTYSLINRWKTIKTPVLFVKKAFLSCLTFFSPYFRFSWMLLSTTLSIF